MKNMRHFKSLAWMMAIAIAGTMTACSIDSYEPEKPILIIDPVENKLLAACGVSESETRSGSYEQLLFTEHDIEWYDATTREIKFRDMHKPLYEVLGTFRQIKFYLGDKELFMANFVCDWDSRLYTGLVLHYDIMTDPYQGHYFLQDCYPLTFFDLDEVQTNVRENAEKLELFTHYLESKGKVKK